MNIILLSGGSGKRLWPLSNNVRSKQFIKIFQNPDGTQESMVQRIYRQIKAVDPNAVITIATSKSQVASIHNQIGNDIGVSVEPCRRDTFPAMALATAYLHDMMGVPDDEVVIVCPVDPYVEEDFFETMQVVEKETAKGEARLVLMGMEPTYPSDRYGYIIPQDKERVSWVETFREKPDVETAKSYISRGALWNGGVFAYKIGYLRDKSNEILGYSDYSDLFANYDSLNKISFDYAVGEKEDRIKTVRFSGEWKDVGTWNALTDVMERSKVGNVLLDEKCENVHVVNELNVPILAVGLKNVVVSASPEGILVSDKEQSDSIKPYVDSIDQQIMFSEKSWGSFRVLDVGAHSLIIKIELLPGHRLHYHSHMHRRETWTVVSGSGLAVVDEKEIPLESGSVVELPIGSKHTLIAKTSMTVIEVQVGESINVEDKEKYSLKERYGEHM